MSDGTGCEGGIQRVREEREEGDEGKEKIEDGRDMSYGVGLTSALNISS